MLKDKICLLRKGNKITPSIMGMLALLYCLLPVCIGEKFVFPNQIQIIVMEAYLAILTSGYLLLKAIFHFHNAEIWISNIDIILFIYILYNACIYLFHFQTIQPELLFENFSLLILYILFRNIKTKYIIYLLLAFPVAGIIQIIYGIKNQANNFAPGYGFTDITGIFYNPGIFGGFIAIAFIVTLLLTAYLRCIIDSKFKNKLLLYLKLLFILVLLTLLIQLIASNSRAAWCACLVGVLYFVISYFGLRSRFLKLSLFKRGLFMMLTINLMCILLLGFYGLKKESADGRILIWKVSSDMIKDKPLFGHGANGFRANYMEYQAEYFKTHPQSPFSYLAADNNYAFNEFIRIWVEQGIIGLSLSLILLYHLFFNKKDVRKNNEAILIKAPLITMLVFGLFSYPMEVFQFNLMAVFFIAIMSTYSIKKKRIRLTGFNRLRRSGVTYANAFMIGIISTCFIVVIGLIPVIYNYTTACKQWNIALKSFNEANTARSIGMLKASYPQLKNNGVFLSTYGKASNLSGRYSEAIPIFLRANIQLPSAANYIELGKSYKATGQFENAKNAWIKASYMVPAMFTPHYLTAKMDCQIGKTAEAQQIANNLLRKEVKIRSPTLNEMLVEMDSIVKKYR